MLEMQTKIASGNYISEHATTKADKGICCWSGHWDVHQNPIHTAAYGMMEEKEKAKQNKRLSKAKISFKS